MRRLIAAAQVLVVVGCTTPVERQPPESATLISDSVADVGRAFEALPARMPRTSNKSDRLDSHYAMLWSTIDNLVVAALSDGRSLEYVQALLRSLPGYQEPRPRDGVQIGNAIFYQDPGAATPSYWLFRPEPNDAQVLIGSYNHKWYSPGRVSVYSLRHGVWSRTGAIDGEQSIRPVVLRSQDGLVGLATVDEFVGGDRIEGTLQFWLVSAGGLVREGPPYSTLVDYQLSFSRDALSVDYTRFLSCMCEATLGTRLEYRLRASAIGHHIEAEDTPRTPWLETLNDLYCRLSGRTRGAAGELFDNPADLELMNPDCGSVLRHSGDLEKGTATAVVRDRTGDFHLDFQKDPAGTWKISRVARTNGNETEPF